MEYNFLVVKATDVEINKTLRDWCGRTGGYRVHTFRINDAGFAEILLERGW